MKELLAPLAGDIFRPLVTLVLPGVLALLPYLLLLRLEYPQVTAILEQHPTACWVSFLLASLFLGLIIESFGSRVEVGWDGQMSQEHNDNWHKYLRLAFKSEPVGQRYLRGILIHLKFELACYVAFLAAIPGAVPLLIGWIGLAHATVATAILCAIAFWLRHEAKCSHGVLSETRKQILAGIFEVPANGSLDIKPEPSSNDPAWQQSRKRSVLIVTSALCIGTWFAVLFRWTALNQVDLRTWVFESHILKTLTRSAVVWCVFSFLSCIGVGAWAQTHEAAIAPKSFQSLVFIFAALALALGLYYFMRNYPYV